MKVVALVDGRASDPDTAYVFRVRKLTEALSERGHEVQMLHLLDRSSIKPAVARPLLGKHFAKELQAADLIHAANSIATVAALRGAMERTPVLFDVHGDAPAEARLEWAIRRTTFSASAMWVLPWYDRIACRHAKALLVVSRPLLDHYLQAGVPRERLFLVRNGVDTTLFAASPIPPEGPSGERWVAYAGATQCWQGLPHLLEEFASLEDTALRLRIVGFGPKDAALKATFSKRLGQRADLRDTVPQEQLVQLLRECHLMIIPRLPHPAVRVAMPTKFGEYCALGRPVLVTGVDETADLVREHRCGFVADWKPGGLRAKLREVAHVSHHELEEMGRRARVFAEQQLAWPKIQEDYLRAVEYCSGRSVV